MKNIGTLRAHFTGGTKEGPSDCQRKSGSTAGVHIQSIRHFVEEYYRQSVPYYSDWYLSEAKFVSRARHP